MIISFSHNFCAFSLKSLSIRLLPYPFVRLTESVLRLTDPFSRLTDPCQLLTDPFLDFPDPEADFTDPETDFPDPILLKLHQKQEQSVSI